MPAENYFEKVQKGGREVKFFCETLGNEGAKQIAMALMDPDTKVQRLVMHSCGIGGESATVIAKALKNSPSLQVLWRLLSNNNTGVDGTKDVAEACKEALKIRSTLQDLSLYCNDLGDVDAMGIAEALKTNSSSLQSLNLSFNKIGVEGATAIADALKINSTLQLLMLEKNNIKYKGATALAETLRINSTLLYLCLGNNNILAVGVAALMEALKSNMTLQKLYLHSNNISDKGVPAIAEALKNNTTLQLLQLGHNNIGEKGGEVLAEALNSNSTLQRLWLDGNIISSALSDHIKSLLSEENREKRRLELKKSKLSDDPTAKSMEPRCTDLKRDDPPQPVTASPAPTTTTLDD